MVLGKPNHNIALTERDLEMPSIRPGANNNYYSTLNISDHHYSGNVLTKKASVIVLSDYDRLKNNHQKR